MPSYKKSRNKKARWLSKQKEVWPGREDDIVVVVMGQTGVGKSTFIHYLLQNAALDPSVERPLIGEELDSCTVNLEPFVIPNGPNGTNRLVIVDTPGFDDTFTADSEILRRIAEWLASSYSKDMKLGGVIYLHDMSQPRMLGTTRKNFEMFEVLCGTDAAKAVVLGMTKSEGLPSDVRKKREQQLHAKFWTEMLSGGAHMERFKKTNESAWKLLYLILGSRINQQLHPIILQIQRELAESHSQNRNELEPHPLILQIQKELVELEKILPSTSAGKKLRYTLEEVLQMQKNSAKTLKSQSGDQRLSAELKEKLDLIENLARQISQLSVSGGFWQHFKSFFA